ncbi:MAG: tRNA (adenosine(37)-N6)-dimethylallyltransferase MiaA [Bacteroidetes bacterium]|nr:tRNA (adenosine(37)-N6)-dimethylallyltransferase MiaA [Bacteroidota bacterium]
MVGPTAIGKSNIGLKLAKDFGGEIISADSRQIYKELSIGAAKPSQKDLNQVTHHFIDELNLGEPYSAGLFATQALNRIEEIFSCGRNPIVVGGSTLYLHALVHGLSPSPPSDPSIRTKIENRLKQIGKDALYEELLNVDPESALTMDSTKTARVVRALEVFELSHRPISSFHVNVSPPPYNFCVTELTLNRPTLYQRIEARVDSMLDNGLIDEVRQISKMDLDPRYPALKSIGYQEPLAYLNNQIGWQQMIDLIKRNSRRYAKRQLTWFRRYDSYRRVSVDNSLEDIIEKITNV